MSVHTELIPSDGASKGRNVSWRARIALFVVALSAMTLSACLTEDASPDPFVGPSELGLSLDLSASPDTLPVDGASQSLVTILARDGNGQTLANLSVRLQIRFAGVFQDLGELSARTLVTGADGRAVATYTAPLSASGIDSGAAVEILATPIGDNFASAVPRVLSIRLVPTGIVVPPVNYTTGFSFTPASPQEFQEVLYTTACASGSTANCVNDPSGQIVSHAWDLGDGQTASGLSVSHTYSATGTYNVNLTTTDAYGRSASVTRSVTVASGGTPTASFTVSPSSPNLGDTVFFNASASTAPDGRSIVSYDWNFGDGGTASGVTASHRFDVAATYRVTLTVTDNRGAISTSTTSVVVANSQPSASFIFSPSTPAVNSSVFFDASASRATVAGRTLVAYDWVFGDGATGSGITVNHAYTFASTFTVSLTVTDSVGERATTTTTVTVGGSGGQPTASFTVSPSPSAVGLNTVVDASGSTPSPGHTLTRYDWDFGETGARFQCPGDAQCGDQNRTFTYVYQRAGSFTINLTVTDTTGQTANTTSTVTVSTQTVAASFAATNTAATGDFVVNFDASASTGTLLTYSWDFGDGFQESNLTVPTVTHTYAAGTERNVTLTVRDVNGVEASTVVSVTPN